MESLIEEFVKTKRGYGFGSGSGSGSDNGSGSGSGSADGSDDGSGYGSGSADGSGSGSADGFGSGYGFCSGFGSGSGYGSGDGDGIVSINNKKVYKIDGVQTIITSIRENVAKGYILQSDLTLTPSFIVREDNKFAHGATLHEAFASLQEKLYDDSSEEERIDKFKEHFSDFDKAYPASELFIWHHILTGSCKAGRESFARDHEIDVQHDYMNIREFINLTKDSYGGKIIKKLL